MTDPFANFGALMVRGRWIVLALWLVVLVSAGLLLAPKASSVAKGGGFTVGGSGSDQAAAILQRDFNASPSNSVVVVFHSTDLTVDDHDFRDQVNAGVSRLKTVAGVESVTGFFNTGDAAFVSPDRHTTSAIVGMGGTEDAVQKAVPALRDQLAGLTIQHYVTGYPAVNYDTFTASEEDLRRSEIFTIPIVMVLLLIVFRTVVASVIPLLLGGCSVVLALAGIYLIGRHLDMSIFALNIASMLGLGLGIDFSLMVISRFREERAGGHASDAVPRTMATAGRSITYSAITVILSMGVLTLFLRDLMIVRSISLGVMLVAVTGLLAGLTLLPAILAILGERLEWLRVMPQPGPRPVDRPGTWYRLSHAIMRQPWRWLLISLLVLLVLASPVRDLAMVGASTGVIPSSKESAQGSRLLGQAFGATQLTPIQIVVHTTQPGGVWTPQFLDALDQLTNAIRTDRRVAQVSSLSTAMASVPRDGRYEALKPDYFTPAPIPTDPTQPPTFPGVAFRPVMGVPVSGLPAGPVYMGLAQFTVPANATIGPAGGPASEVIQIAAGTLTVAQSDGHLTLSRSNGAGGVTSQPIPANATLALNVGDQLVIPPGSQVAFRTGAQPVDFLGVSVFVPRPGADPQASWIDSQTAPDPFGGVPRKVLAGGLVDRLPRGQATLTVEQVTVQPGASLMRHTQPGPSLLAVEQGTLTLYGAPEIAATTVGGQAAPTTLETPIELATGGSAVIQASGINHWKNAGSAPVGFLTAAILDPAQPPLSLVGPTQLVDQFVNLGGNSDTAVIDVVARSGEYTREHQQLVYDLRNTIIPGIPQLSAYSTYVGGDAAAFVDFRDTLYSRFPTVVLLVSVMIFFILMMFFQSVFLPLKAMFMNLVSILATYGVLVVIFEYGHGSRLLGFTSQGLLSAITPAVLYVILFSLSTDYEVFMLSRVKEYFHETGDNEEAVAYGLEHTAGVITAAGLILVGTFGSFASANVVTIKEIGLGLAIGVLIDSTIVRVIMVPATMRLMGARNWWMPEWLKRIVPELSEGPAPEAAPVAVLAVAGGGEIPVSVMREPPPRPSPVSHPAPPVATSGPPPETRAAGPRPAHLRPVNGSVGVGVVTVSPGRPLTIGRDQRNDLQLFDPHVSRFHARIEYADDGYQIVDLNSSNGIYLNGSLIPAQPERAALREGDLIELGSTGIVGFVFECGS
ncbi:MAG TPA: MMPL family transporter [Thermomicrobiaceae bacterium]|nr:MMPL family transporter [Thermomicrobiaceae bacterium]